MLVQNQFVTGQFAKLSPVLKQKLVSRRNARPRDGACEASDRAAPELPGALDKNLQSCIQLSKKQLEKINALNETSLRADFPAHIHLGKKRSAAAEVLGTKLRLPNDYGKSIRSDLLRNHSRLEAEAESKKKNGVQSLARDRQKVLSTSEAVTPVNRMSVKKQLFNQAELSLEGRHSERRFKEEFPQWADSPMKSPNRVQLSSSEACLKSKTPPCASRPSESLKKVSLNIREAEVGQRIKSNPSIKKFSEKERNDIKSKYLPSTQNSKRLMCASPELYQNYLRHSYHTFYRDKKAVLDETSSKVLERAGHKMPLNLHPPTCGSRPDLPQRTHKPQADKPREEDPPQESKRLSLKRQGVHSDLFAQELSPGRAAKDRSRRLRPSFIEKIDLEPIPFP